MQEVLLVVVYLSQKHSDGVNIWFIYSSVELTSWTIYPPYSFLAVLIFYSKYLGNW